MENVERSGAFGVPAVHNFGEEFGKFRALVRGVDEQNPETSALVPTSLLAIKDTCLPPAKVPHRALSQTSSHTWLRL